MSDKGVVIDAQLIRDELEWQVKDGIEGAEEKLKIISALGDDTINSVIANPRNDYFWELFDQMLSMAIMEVEEFAGECAEYMLVEEAELPAGKSTEE